MKNLSVHLNDLSAPACAVAALPKDKLMAALAELEALSVDVKKLKRGLDVMTSDIATLKRDGEDHIQNAERFREFMAPRLKRLNLQAQYK